MKTKTIDSAFALLIITLVILVTSCSKNHVPTVARADTVIRTVIEEKVRDTTIYLNDSSGITALLECDSLGRVRIKQITDYYAGQFVKPKIVIKDNYLQADCTIDSAKVYVSWKEKHVTSTTSTSQTVIVKENYLTGWQWFQLWTGKILIILILVLLVLFIGYRIVKLYTKISLPF